ncbi:MAG: hypothetical protein AAF927_01480 [Bacteroidota bacterium]
MKAQLSKMALIGLCLLLLLSTIQSLSQGQKLYRSLLQWQEVKPLWAQAQNAPHELVSKEAKLEELRQNNRFTGEKIDLNEPLALVQYLEDFCQGKNLRLTRLPEAIQKESSGIAVQDTQFSLEGSLSDILQLLYQIEYKDHLGELVQLHLETEYLRQNGRKQKFLFAHVSLQNPLAL